MYADLNWHPPFFLFAQYMICAATTPEGNACKVQAEPNSLYCRYHQVTPIVVKVRCKALNNKKTQCQHTTLRGLYCHQHLDKFEHLRVAKSTLPGAGLGVFATKPFARGQTITGYTGDRVVSNDPNYGNDYVLQIKRNPPTYIDARKTANDVGRYVNARRRGQGRNNCQITFARNTGKASIRAVQNIPTNAELSAAYGSQYWRAGNHAVP